MVLFGGQFCECNVEVCFAVEPDMSLSMALHISARSFYARQEERKQESYLADRQVQQVERLLSDMRTLFYPASYNASADKELVLGPQKPGQDRSVMSQESSAQPSAAAL